jgi:outer membrane usher protein
VQTPVALLIGVAVLTAAAATPAGAQERTVWALVVNDEPKGNIEVILRDDGPWVSPQTLLDAGLRHVPEGVRRPIGPAGAVWVSLDSLAPDLTYRLDDAEIRLLVSAAPALLPQADFAIMNPRPPGWKVTSSAAAFLNYAVNWSTEFGTQGYGEFGLRMVGQLFQTSAVIDDKGKATPGLTSWTVDQVRSRRRWVVGDSIGRSTTLGSAPVVGGFSVSTQPDLDPYYAAYPAPRVQGAVRTPSTADIYVDGRLVSSVRLPPGRFTLSDLPIETGLGNARIVIRDAFGREQFVNLGFYLTTDLLKRGEQDYAYLVGAERTVTDNAVDYGRIVSTALHRVGLTDWLTIGAQAEGAKDVAAAGVAVQARLWRLGVAGLEALASGDAEHSRGWAATGAYSFLARRISFDLRGTRIGPNFQNLYLLPATDVQWYLDGSVSIDLGRIGSLTLNGTHGSADQYLAQTRQSAPDLLGRVFQPIAQSLREAAQDRIGRIGYTVNASSRIQVSLVATHTDKFLTRPTWEGFASISVAIGRRTMANSVTTVDPDGKTATSIDVQRSLPRGPGIGFRFDSDLQDPYRTQGIVEVQHRRGLVGLQMSGASGEDVATTVNVAGSIVTLGREVAFSRVIDDGFALVKVPNSRGVTVLANNQVAGKTNRHGSLFVPDLHAYLSSPIAIRPDDVPVDVKLGPIRQQLAVPYRGGAVVTFEAEVIRALTGRFDPGSGPPAYGTATVEASGRRFESPLNGTGEFYFESLPAGEWTATVSWGVRVCRATLRMPKDAPPITDLGAVACVEEKR